MCDASCALCHRLFLVTNSSPPGTQRLRPRETGEEEVGAGRGEEEGKNAGLGAPRSQFRVPGARLWELGEEVKRSSTPAPACRLFIPLRM